MSHDSATPAVPDGLPRSTTRRLVRQTRAVLDLVEAAPSSPCEDMRVRDLAEAVRAAQEHLGLRAHPNQVLAALVLHDGVVIEMATGEGKTLSAALAASLWVREGHRVHIVTANDYLAARDADWMRPLFTALDITVAHVADSDGPTRAREAYAADVVYATLPTLALHFLRDRTGAAGIEEPLQAPASCVLVDEADAVLIDAARQTISLSRPDTLPARDWARYAAAAKALVVDEDITVTPSENTVALTEAGYAHAARLLGVSEDELSRSAEMVHHLDAALVAEHLYRNGRDYLVDAGRIVLIDPLSGRRMGTSRLRGSVQPALETKEGLALTDVTRTAASISVRAFLTGYEVMAGMTGTFGHDDVEITDVYGVGTARIPRHLPSARIDHADEVFVTEAEKFTALAGDIIARRDAGQPVLVSAPSVADAEAISARLLALGIDHALLTARDPQAEADVLAQAGRPGQVTVATSMAGRGVDIVLGGDPRRLAAAAIADQDQPSEAEAARELARWEAACVAARAKALQAGGMAILATSRHASKRADDQLRGRCARQGEPGETVFYLSLEDDLVTRFAPAASSGFLARLLRRAETLSGRGQQMSRDRISKLIDAAQSRADQASARSRGRVLRYDFVISAQRDAVFTWRQEALTADVRELLVSAITITDSVRDWAAEGLEDTDMPSVESEAETIWQGVRERSPGVGDEVLEEVTRRLLLEAIDTCWSYQIEDLDALTDVVGLRSTGVRSSSALLHEYTKAAAEGFADMRVDVATRFRDRMQGLTVRVRTAPETPTDAPSTETPDAATAQAPASDAA